MWNEIIGWIGSVMVILAYGLNSYQKIKSNSFVFYTLNIIGGSLLIVYSINKEAYPNVFINVVWVMIALPALLKIVTRKSH